MRGFVEAGLDSALLRDLTTPGTRLPDLSVPLKELLEAADWNAAAEQGRIVPNEVGASVQQVFSLGRRNVL